MLSLDITSNIICQLAKVTGTPSVQNDADIPFVFKYLEAYTSTNTLLYAMRNDLGLIGILLATMADRFKIAEEELAAGWNSLWTRKWLWNHCQKADYLEHYMTICKIVSVTQKLADSLKESDSGFKLKIAIKSPSRLSLQTKKGITLSLGYCRAALETPFGRIKLIKGKDIPSHSAFSFMELIIDQLGAQFDSFSCRHDIPRKIIRIAAPTNAGTIRNLRKETKAIRADPKVIDEAKGTANLVCCRCHCPSNYRITKLGDTPLSPLITEALQYKAKEPIRSEKLILILWKMLERNDQKKDPFEKGIAVKTSSCQSVKQNPLFKNISEIESVAIDILEKLATATPTNEGWISLTLPNEQILMMKSLIRACLEKHKEYKLNFFSRKNIINIDHSEENISISTLKEQILEIFRELKIGWIAAKLSDFPALPYKKSEEEWSLFIKREIRNHKEIDVIYFIAAQLNKDHVITGCNYGFNLADKTPFPYLWIKKECLQKVEDAFGFNFNSAKKILI